MLRGCRLRMLRFVEVLSGSWIFSLVICFNKLSYFAPYQAFLKLHRQVSFTKRHLMFKYTIPRICLKFTTSSMKYLNSITDFWWLPCLFWITLTVQTHITSVKRKWNVMCKNHLNHISDFSRKSCFCVVLSWEELRRARNLRMHRRHALILKKHMLIRKVDSTPIWHILDHRQR